MGETGFAAASRDNMNLDYKMCALEINEEERQNRQKKRVHARKNLEDY